MNIKKIKLISLIPKTAYLTGVIVGDGNLANWSKSKKDFSQDYRITIDISDLKYLKYLEKLIKSVVKTKATPNSPRQRGNRIPRPFLFIRNKSLFYFFHENMGIPKGKKSNYVSVPHRITKASNSIKKNFLAGYFDTDGGFRGNTLGFTTAGRNLHEGVSQLLLEFKVTHSKECWINKRYKKKFYGIRLKKREIDRFLNILPLQNKEKLIRIRNRFMRGCRSGQTG
jgi:intein/homing endonuclease